MKLLILNGSPKCERSNTLNIAKAFAEGFPESTEVEILHLAKMHIKPCLGCFSCWGKTAGKCVIDDDMGIISEKILASDIIVESFPLYFFGMPSTLKAMTDRCLPFMKPYEGGFAGGFHEMRDGRMNIKKLVIISTCGYVEAAPMYEALRKQLDSICGKSHYTAIFCPQGELFVSDYGRRQREGYLRDIKRAGEEFADSFTISPETRSKIDKPILSPAEFEAITSAHWKQQKPHG